MTVAGHRSPVTGPFDFTRTVSSCRGLIPTNCRNPISLLLALAGDGWAVSSNQIQQLVAFLVGGGRPGKAQAGQ
jgi:hypothetical protein